MHPTFELTGRTAIVTGASKGIGKAIAKMMLHHGANVVISSRSQEQLDACLQELSTTNARAVAAHMGDTDAITGLVRATLDIFGDIDIIVNNAAINPYFGGLSKATKEAFDKTMQVNVWGPLELAKAAYPQLKGKGSVINISSVEGVIPAPAMGIYSMSKSALISQTRTLAKEWGAKRIRVNAICPGLIETKLSKALIEDKVVLEHIMNRQALPDIAQPEHIAGLATFLASEAAAFCTGGIYMADGGYTA